MAKRWFFFFFLPLKTSWVRAPRIQFPEAKMSIICFCFKVTYAFPWKTDLVSCYVSWQHPCDDNPSSSCMWERLIMPRTTFWERRVYQAYEINSEGLGLAGWPHWLFLLGAVRRRWGGKDGMTGTRRVAKGCHSCSGRAEVKGGCSGRFGGLK